MSNRRSKSKYPNLNPRFTLKHRQELIDFDYLDKLDEESLKFLNTFVGEWVGASFKKKSDTEYCESNLHKTSEQRKELYSNNNKRNHDIYTKKSCTKGLDRLTECQLDDLRDKDLNKDANAFEDAMIELDFLKKNPAILKEQIREYLETLSKSKKTGQKVSEYNSYISFLNENGLSWVLED